MVAMALGHQCFLSRSKNQSIVVCADRFGRNLTRNRYVEVEPRARGCGRPVHETKTVGPSLKTGSHKEFSQEAHGAILGHLIIGDGLQLMWVSVDRGFLGRTCWVAGSNSLEDNSQPLSTFEKHDDQGLRTKSMQTHLAVVP